MDERSSLETVSKRGCSFWNARVEATSNRPVQARQLRKVFAGERAAGDVFAALKAARPDVGEAPGALLGALLDVLHHDLNLFRGERETLAWFYDDKKSDEVNAKGAADVDASLDLSIVRDVFLGRLMRTHRPAADPGAVATKDFGGFLVLPVPDGGPDLAACLAKLFEEPEPKADVEFHGVVGDGFVKTRLCVAPEHLASRRAELTSSTRLQCRAVSTQSSSTVLRELDESNRFVQVSPECDRARYL